MHQTFGLLNTPHVGFVTLIIVGGLAGWIAGMILRIRHGIFTNILVGVCGAWIGSELAEIAHVVVRNRVDYFVAALVGSVVLLYIWQWINRRA